LKEIRSPHYYYGKTGQQETGYPRVEDNQMVVYRDGSYHVRLKVLDSPISPSFSLDNFICGSLVRNPHVPPAYYLVSPCRLGMVKVVRQVVEPGKSNRVQVPNNDRIPLLQCTAPLLSTAFKLKLLRCNNAVFSVNDHELIVLDLIPILGLYP
jgi:hypothetical protein